MVAQRLGDFARPETPEEEWFEEDDEGWLRINLLRAPTLPAVVAAQTNSWVPDPPPQTSSVGTQMTTTSTEDKAVQAFPTYGTTKYCYGSTRAGSQLGVWLFWSLLRPGLRDTPSVDALSPVVL
jgi:hypothetical protein